MLTIKTRMKVSQACVLSTLLYSSETWTLYSHQGSRLNAFHPSCLIQILGITLHNYVPNKNVLAQTRIPSMLALLAQRRLRWLGHLSRMEDGRIPKEMLYGELATCRKACPSIQRRLQTRSEGRRHQLRRLGGCSCRPRQLEARRRNRDPDKQEEERRPVGRLERAQMTE